MPSLSPRHRALVLLLPLAAACDASGGALGPVLLPPLEATTWHVHAANGIALPALTAHGLVEGRLQQDFLDSARVEVTADGQWTLGAWFERFVDQRPEDRFVRQDVGTWVPTDTGYLFTSASGQTRFVVRDPRLAAQTLRLSVEGIPGALLAEVRREAPPRALPGEWRAVALRGTPLANTPFEVIDPVELDGRMVSIHLFADSSRLVLRTNGTYEHRVWISEHEGDAGGPAHTKRGQFTLGDHGVWQRTGDELLLTSNWVEDHRMLGTLLPDGGLQLQHGIDFGGPFAPFRYAR